MKGVKMKIKLTREKPGSYSYGDDYHIYRWIGDNCNPGMCNWSISKLEGLGWEHVEDFHSLKEARAHLAKIILG